MMAGKMFFNALQWLFNVLGQFFRCRGDWACAGEVHELSNRETLGHHDVIHAEMYQCSILA